MENGIEKIETARDIIRHTHRLVSAIDRIADTTLREEADLPLSHFRIMLAVHKYKAMASQQDIASFWGITPAAVSRQIQVLKKKGLIREESSAGSAPTRKHTIVLTGSGVQKMKKMFHSIDRVFEAAFAKISEKDKATAMNVIIAMRRGLSTHPALKKLDELCDVTMKHAARHREEREAAKN